MKELIKAAEGMLAALSETAHEKYGGYRVGCICPRCKLVVEMQMAKTAVGGAPHEIVKR